MFVLAVILQLQRYRCDQFWSVILVISIPVATTYDIEETTRAMSLPKIIL